MFVIYNVCDYEDIFLLCLYFGEVCGEYIQDEKQDKEQEELNRKLLLMAYSGTASNISYLIVAGADVNARDDDGMTPLMWAAMMNTESAVIRTLLDAGADAKARDQSGKTALDYAKENKAIYKTDAYWKLNDASY